ncbi:MAG TPA: hypothetical protein VGR06_24390 [Actinophytocola sp.]|jgi:hypothetical protein|uniref:hypothetical protein n=1 Tax=Actinophytocola sp. TaxID=1872138 RepID=UPI002E0487DC|nr:hypothetical protein [Actinophytocola sp.]
MSIAAGAIGGAVAGAAAAIGESFAVFAKGAASGSFAISETGGKALLQAIRNLKDWVDENQHDVQRLGMEPQLGTSHGANVMKPHVANVATDGQGFMPMLTKLRESLEDAEQGIKDAMANYQAMDQRGAGRQQSA